LHVLKSLPRTFSHKPLSRDSRLTLTRDTTKFVQILTSQEPPFRIWIALDQSEAGRAVELLLNSGKAKAHLTPTRPRRETNLRDANIVNEPALLAYVYGEG